MVQRTYRVRFFRFAIYEDGEQIPYQDAGRIVARVLAGPTLPQLGLTQDYHYQLREVQRPNPNRYTGCFAKLRPDAPHIIRANTGQEQRIPLAPGDKIVDKSYFTFFPAVALLAMQMNRDGGSITRLVEYLNSLIATDGNRVLICEDIIRQDAMDQLEQHAVKWFEVSFVRPRNVRATNPNDWTSRTVGNLGGLNAGRVKIRVAAPRSDDLGGRTADFLHDLFRHGQPRSLKVKFEDMATPIDMLAEAIQGEIQLRLEGGYPDPGVVLREIMRVYVEQRDRIQEVFGDAERLP
jgi:hypothetical protein